MNRRERERALLEIVGERPVRTQRQLVEALRARGIDVTQATISRDVKRLGLVKVPDPDGGYRYARPEDTVAPPPASREALASAVRDFVTGLDEAQGILVVTTHPGCANAVAIAMDEADLPGLVATVAGDDTIFALARTSEARRRLRKRLGDLLAEG